MPGEVVTPLFFNRTLSSSRMTDTRHLSQELIARMLGMQRPSISIAAAQLKRAS